MTEAQLRHVRELLTQINTEALRATANLASGQARTGAYALGKIARLAEDAGRVLDGEAPAPAGPQPFIDSVEVSAAKALAELDRPTDDPRYSRGAH